MVASSSTGGLRDGPRVRICRDLEMGGSSLRPKVPAQSNGSHTGSYGLTIRFDACLRTSVGLLKWARARFEPQYTSGECRFNIGSAARSCGISHKKRY